MRVKLGSSDICCVLTICESSWVCVFTSTPPAATTSIVVVTFETDSCGSTVTAEATVTSTRVVNFAKPVLVTVSS